MEQNLSLKLDARSNQEPPINSKRLDPAHSTKGSQSAEKEKEEDDELPSRTTPPPDDSSSFVAKDVRPKIPDDALEKIRELAEWTLNRPRLSRSGPPGPAMMAVKIVTVGDGAVGKTFGLTAYTNEYSPNVMVEGIPVHMGLYDTVGREEHDKIRPLSYPQTDVFLLCYSVADRASFNNIRARWLPELRQHGPPVPIFLIATKIDLRYDEDVAQKVQIVNTEEGVALCEEENLQGYLEISAMAGVGLKEMFDTALRVLVNVNAPPTKKKQRCLVQ